MKILMLILHLLPYVPAIQTRPPAPMPAAAGGTGTILIVNCRPGAPLSVEPGNLRGVVGRDGVARIQAPAQDERAESYRVYHEGVSFDLNGILSANESLSGVCP